MSFKKPYFLFIIFGLLVFGLVFPRISLALCGPGCETACPVIYCTECGECFQIGECCSSICCEECCTTECDEKGNCWEDCSCCGECIVCSCSGQSWPEYKCDSPDCDGDILVRYCHVYHDCGPCAMGSCVDECCCVSCTAPEICEDCGSWQKPEREPCACPRWGLQKPECRCKGECIDKPESPRYYKNSFYPKNECNVEQEYQMEKDKIYLPLKLDWDDVRGWKDQWQEGGCKYVKDCQGGGKR